MNAWGETKELTTGALLQASRSPMAPPLEEVASSCAAGMWHAEQEGKKCCKAVDEQASDEIRD